MGVHLTAEQRALAFRLRAKGMSVRGISKELGHSVGGVHVLLRGQMRDGTTSRWTPRHGALSLEDREEIRYGLAHGDSMSAIARSINRSPSTVTREVKANGGRNQYRVWPAHQRAEGCAQRPKATKLAQHQALCAKVIEWLESFWSPEEISGRLRDEFPDDETMRVSHETIYQSLFVQGRGELRRELTRCLRSGRTQRKTQGHVELRGKISNMINISERPAEVQDRAVPGHWDGDLIIGAGGRSAVGTLVERTTRTLLLLHLPDKHGAPEVEAAMKKAIADLPAELVRTVTWDQGPEMSRHAEFSVATGIPVYFCDPHAPWQRGSNENTNGLLRQYMPKGTDLSKYSVENLLEIQRSLNGRPRKTLGFKMPSEKFAELVALTA